MDPDLKPCGVSEQSRQPEPTACSTQKSGQQWKASAPPRPKEGMRRRRASSRLLVCGELEVGGGGEWQRVGGGRRMGVGRGGGGGGTKRTAMSESRTDAYQGDRWVGRQTERAFA